MPSATTRSCASSAARLSSRRPACTATASSVATTAAGGSQSARRCRRSAGDLDEGGEVSAMDVVTDRQAILDCLYRYTRGVDRLDDELIKSAYHPDAIDYHGSSFQGGPDGFVQWLHGSHVHRTTSQHFLTNVTYDIDGDTAHVESYFMVPIRRDDQPDTIGFVCGRYCDRFEKRDGDWRIALRVVITESVSQAAAVPIDAISDAGRRDRTDASYARPLEGPPPPQQR